MDTAVLKARLHDAIERVVDGLVVEELSDEEATAALTAIVSSEESGSLAYLLTVEPLGETDDFVYRWPDGQLEDYYLANDYRVGGKHRVIVARTSREAWGKIRDRAVVFGAARDNDPPERWYPWTEFVETDDGDYAATIPNPDRPRALLTERDYLPRRFVDQRVERADAVFRSIRAGASLRVVVDEYDEEAMIRHGHWVAALRGRVDP